MDKQKLCLCLTAVVICEGYNNLVKHTSRYIYKRKKLNLKKKHIKTADKICNYTELKT